MDDDFNTCDSVTAMLQQMGLRSEWTTSGKEAVARVNRIRPPDGSWETGSGGASDGFLEFTNFSNKGKGNRIFGLFVFPFVHNYSDSSDYSRIGRMSGDSWNLQTFPDIHAVLRKKPAYCKKL